MMAEAYALQSEDRQAFQQWVKDANKKGWRRSDDPNHNSYYVASKLPASALSAVLFVLQIKQLVKINGH